MSLEIFDTHSHYYEESFDLDRDELLKSQFDMGVKKILTCAVDLDSCKKTIDLTNKYEFIYGACGIHPSYTEYYYKTDYLNKLYEYHKCSNILAVGEIGLDYYHKEVDREIQKSIFKEQLALAKEIDKPVVIHSREAHKDTLDIIKEFKGVSGVIHCYSGSLDTARELVKLGFFLGISGIATFKNACNIIDVIKYIPIEHLVTETDCPYLAPVPFRGKRNESIYIEYIVKKIAEIREEDFYKIGDTLYKNALRFLRL